MAKRLQIIYDDNVIYDGEPEQFTWNEGANGAIEVKAGPQQPNALQTLVALANRQSQQTAVPRQLSQ